MAQIYPCDVRKCPNRGTKRTSTPTGEIELCEGCWAEFLKQFGEFAIKYNHRPEVGLTEYLTQDELAGVMLDRAHRLFEESLREMPQIGSQLYNEHVRQLAEAIAAYQAIDEKAD